MPRKSLSRVQRVRIFDAAKGICHLCGLKIDAPRGDLWDVSHEIPLEAGGADESHNMKPAHRRCHRQHTAEVDAPLIAKVKRQRAKNLGVRKPSRPMPGSRASNFKHHMDGTVSRRSERP